MTDITMTSATGTVKSIGPDTYARIGFYIRVTLDNGGGDMGRHLDSTLPLKAGDRVSVTITDGPSGKLLGSVKKID